MSFRAYLQILLLPFVVLSALTTNEDSPSSSAMQDIQAGVDLFSGNASFTQPLFSIPDRNGSITASLRYSSNVMQMVRSRNDHGQTPWVGLGWHLSFGAVIRNDLGTPSTDDDEFLWIGPRGETSRIVSNTTGTYYLADHPYWKVSALSNGWKMVDGNGVQYQYGVNADAQRVKPTWGDGGDEVYQYDISSVTDYVGNMTTYSYTRDQQPFKGTRTYTRASYLKEIVFPTNAKVEFILTDRDPSEFYDYYQFKEEGTTGDGFAEVFETKRLDKIRVYDRKMTVIETVQLNYKLIKIFDQRAVDWGMAAKSDPTEPDMQHYGKALLTSIVGSNNDGQKFTSTEFTYYDNLYRINDNTYNLGALRTVKNSDCGVTEFEYERRWPSENTKSRDFPLADVYGLDYSVSLGSTDEGRDFFVVRSADKRYVGLYQWNGWCWDVVDGFDHVDLEYEGAKKIKAGSNSFMVATKVGTSCVYFVYHWDRERWNVSTFSDEEEIVADKIYAGAGYFVVKKGQKHRHFVWRSEGWSSSFLVNNPDATDPYGFPSGTEVFVAANFFLVRDSDKDAAILYNRDGTFGLYEDRGRPPFNTRYPVVLTFESSSWRDGNEFDLYTGGNFFVMRSSDKEWVNVYSKTESGWIRTMHDKDLDNVEAEIYPGRDFFVVRRDGQEHIRVYSWDGDGWTKTMASTHIAKEYCNVYPSPSSDCFTVGYRTRYGPGGILIPQEDNGIKMVRWNGTEWKVTGLSNLGLNRTKYVLGADHGSLVYSEDMGKAWSILWNGSEWKRTPLITATPNVEYGTSENAGLETTPMVAGRSFAFRMKVKRDRTASGPAPVDHKLVCYKRDQDGFDRPVAYVVAEKRNFDGLRNIYDPDAASTPTTKAEYEYDWAATYNTTTGSLQNAKVTATNGPTGGSVSTYYYNWSGRDKQNEHEDHEKLVGLPYKTESFSEANSDPVSHDSTIYEIHSETDWPSGVEVKRPTKVLSKKLGVATSTEFASFDAHNGLPSSTVTVGSNGEEKTVVTGYMHDKYTEGTLEANLLSGACATVTYEGSAGSANARSGAVLTWKKPGFHWLPDATYGWKVDPHASPPPSFEEFGFGDGASNPQWRTMGRIVDYDLYGQQIVTENAVGVRTAQILAEDGTLRIAQVQNAVPQEVGVFTCDFSPSNPNNPYFDMDNGWLKNGAVLSSEQCHFGERSVFVASSQIGPSKEVASVSDRDYVFCAWVRPTGAASTPSVRLDVLIDGTDPRPGDGLKTSLSPNSWQHVVRKIRKQDMPGSGSVTIRISSANNTSFYVDDIRFHPSNAFVTTRYHTQEYRQIYCTVDANCQSTGYTVYDDFAQPVKWFDSDQKLVKEQKYYHACAFCPSEVTDATLKTLAPSVGVLSPALQVGRFSYTVTVPYSTTKMTLQPEPRQPGATVSFDNDVLKDGEFIALTVAPGQNDYELIVTAPDGVTTNTYYVAIIRTLDCWALVGDAGISPVGTRVSAFGIHGSTPYVAYADPTNDDKLVVKKWDGSAWVTVGPTDGISDGGIAELEIAFTSTGVPLVAYVDESLEDKVVVKKFESGAWSALAGDGTVSTVAASNVVLAVSGAIPYVGYLDDVNDVSGSDATSEASRVIVKKCESGIWSKVGGDVSSASCSELSLAVSAGGTPYVAYAHSQNADETSTTDDPDQGRLVVKKFSGGSWQAEPVGSGYKSAGQASHISLSLDGSTPYVLFCDEDNGNTANVISFDGINWNTVATTNFLRNDPGASMALGYIGSAPYVAFSIADNSNRATMVKQNGTSWEAVGNPGFSPPGATGVMMACAGTTPYVAFHDASAQGGLSVMYHAGSCDNLVLSSLTLPAGHALTPSFKPYILNYGAVAEYYESQIQLTPTASNGSNTVTVNGTAFTTPIALSTQQNTPGVINVTGASGASLSYNVSIERKSDSYALLCDFDVFDAEGAELTYTPTFSPFTENYALAVGATASKITVVPKVSNEATIFVGGQQVASEGEAEQDLRYGVSVIPIMVTAPDGETIKEYRLTVTRPIDPDVELSALSITDNLSQSVSFTPTFGSSTFYYQTVAVATATTSVTISATGPTGSDVQVGSNENPSDPITLAGNVTTVSINVTNNGKTSFYCVDILRLPDPSAKLTGLVVKDNSNAVISLTPSPFSGNVYSYDGTIGEDVQSANFTPTFSSGTTMTVEDVPIDNGTTSPDFPVHEGTNTFHVVAVSTSDPTKATEYRVLLEKAFSTPEPKVSFAVARSSSMENAEKITVSVTLSAASELPVSVRCSAATDGSATSGTDFSFSDITLTFAPCEQKKTVELTIKEDALFEGDETVVLKLSNATNAGLGSDTYTHTIVDDDIPKVTFIGASGGSTEGEPTKTVTVRIYPQLAAGKTVTVDYEVTGGTATEGANEDYSLSGGTITFSHAVSSFDLPLTIHADHVPDAAPTETIQIGLKNVTGGAKIGSPAAFVYSIRDNDYIRYVRAYIGTAGHSGTPATYGEADAGTTWDHAYRYLNDALKDAREHPGAVKEIRVAEGDYFPNEGVDAIPDGPAATFPLAPNVKVKGGYKEADAGATRDRHAETNGTVLSGSFLVSNPPPPLPPTAMQSYHVVTGADNAVLDGFTVRNGYYREPSGTVGGAGLYCDANSEMAVLNCKFESSWSTQKGAAVYSGAGIWLECCVFSDNRFVDDPVTGFPPASGSGIVHLTPATNAKVRVLNCSFPTNDNRGHGDPKYGNHTILFGGSSDMQLVNTSICYDNSTSGGSAVRVVSGGLAVWNSILATTPPLLDLSYYQLLAETGSSVSVSNSAVLKGTAGLHGDGVVPNPNTIYSFDLAAEVFDVNTLKLDGTRSSELAVNKGDNNALWADEYDADGDGITSPQTLKDLAGVDRIKPANGTVDLGPYEK